jgi:phage protein D
MATMSNTLPTMVAAIPHPIFVTIYDKKNITADITPYVLTVSYTDYLSGQSDEIAIELEDTDGRWLNAWYPGKGDSLTLKIGYEGQPLLSCGSFEIDEIEHAFPPSRVSIKALSTGIKKSIRTRTGRAYENTTLASIAAQIAKRNKLTLTGKIRDIAIDRVTQYQEADVAFLTRLARAYGYAFKIVGSKLVFTEQAALRDGQAVTKIALSDVSSVRLRDKIKDIYNEAKVTHHDPKTKKLIVYGVKDGELAQVGTATSSTNKKPSGQSTSGDTLKVTTRAGSKAAAQIKAKAALDDANKEQTTGSITLIGNPLLVAGNTLMLDNSFGKLKGKYLIESASHRIERSSGYTTELEIKRVAAAAKGVATKKANAQKGLQVYGVKDDKVQVVGTSPTPERNQKK